MSDLIDRLRRIDCSHKDAFEAAAELTLLRQALAVAMRELRAFRGRRDAVNANNSAKGVDIETTEKAIVVAVNRHLAAVVATDSNPILAEMMKEIT